jgi:hypothetical protein
MLKQEKKLKPKLRNNGKDSSLEKMYWLWERRFS